MRRARKSERWLSSIRAISFPSIRTFPVDTSSRPERQFSSVVFPHPEGPITATTSPRRTRRSTPRSASTETFPVSYVFRTFRHSMTVPPIEAFRPFFSGAVLGAPRSTLLRGPATRGGDPLGPSSGIDPPGKTPGDEGSQFLPWHLTKAVVAHGPGGATTAGINGPEGIRTLGLSVKSRPLYLAKLRARPARNDRATLNLSRGQQLTVYSTEAIVSPPRDSVNARRCVPGPIVGGHRTTSNQSPAVSRLSRGLSR